MNKYSGYGYGLKEFMFWMSSEFYNWNIVLIFEWMNNLYIIGNVMKEKVLLCYLFEKHGVMFFIYTKEALYRVVY